MCERGGAAIRKSAAEGAGNALPATAVRRQRCGEQRRTDGRAARQSRTGRSGGRLDATVVPSIATGKPSGGQPLHVPGAMRSVGACVAFGRRAATAAERQALLNGSSPAYAQNAASAVTVAVAPAASASDVPAAAAAAARTTAEIITTTRKPGRAMDGERAKRGQARVGRSPFTPRTPTRRAAASRRWVHDS